MKEALAAAEGAEEVDVAYVSTLKGALSIDAQIEELTKERKELASSGPRDKHFNQGSLLLFTGIAFAIEVREFIYTHIMCLVIYSVLEFLFSVVFIIQH